MSDKRVRFSNFVAALSNRFSLDSDNTAESKKRSSSSRHQRQVFLPHGRCGRTGSTYVTNGRPDGGSQKMSDAVRLPEFEDKFEWIAVHIVDFLNEISFLYGLCDEDSKQFTKPGEGFPNGYEYRWADGVNVTKPIRCSSAQYVNFVLEWARTTLDDEKLFPTMDTDEFPEDFLTIARLRFRHFFRIFAIIFWRHFKALEAMDAEMHLKTKFKHFMFFSFEFDLLDEQETNALAKPVARLYEDFKAIRAKEE